MTSPNTQSLRLPDDVRAVLKHFFTAEFSTIAKDGTPVTWPVTTQFRETSSDFLLCTSIGYPGKVYNIKRNGKVSLSYTDPTGSGLTKPPRVVVQGTATVDDQIRTSVDGLEDFWVENVMGPQPASKMLSSNAFMRWFADFYYMRHFITVKPVRICWWPDGDDTRTMESIEVNQHVE